MIKDLRVVLIDIVVVLSLEDGFIYNEFVFIFRIDVNIYVINVIFLFVGNFWLIV